MQFSVLPVRAGGPLLADQSIFVINEKYLNTIITVVI